MPVFLPLPQTSTEVTSPTKISSTPGKILFQDDFEGALKWAVVTASTTATEVYAGGTAGKITTKATASWDTTGETHFPVTPDVTNSKLGFECVLRPDAISNTQIEGFYIKCTVATAEYGFKWTPTAAATGKLQYLSSAGTWTDVTDGAFNCVANQFYRVKIVVNLITGKYDYLEFGTQRFDLSAIAFKTATKEYGYIYLNITGIDANQFYLHIDNVLVTYDEP